MLELDRTLRTLMPLTALAFAGTVGAQSSERVTLSGDSVAIYNLAGRATIESGSGSDVVVEVTRGGADASRLTQQTGDIRGRQTLRIIYPEDRVVYRDRERDRERDRDDWRGRTSMRVRDDGTFGDGYDRHESTRRVEIVSSGTGTEGHADLRIVVPAGKHVHVYWGVGDAQASNVDGDLSIDVASASVTTRATRGRLSIDAGSGGVHVTDASGRVSIDAGSGGATLTGVHGGPLSADVGSGHVTMSDIDVTSLSIDAGSGGVDATAVKTSDVKIDAGSGGVELTLLSDVRELRVEAGSGGVTLRVPSTLSAELDVETGSGGITSDFPIAVTRTERHALRGRIGSGEGRVHIETGSGGVRLLKS